MNSPPASDALRAIAGYPYWPLVLRQTPPGSGVADRFHVMLKDGGLAKVKEMIAARPQLLAELLPIVANPEASINVRIGASVVFEDHEGSAALRALVPRLADLARDADARVRADACFYLGLSGHPRAREHLLPRLADDSAEVREIAADGLEALAAAKHHEIPTTIHQGGTAVSQAQQMNERFAIAGRLKFDDMAEGFTVARVTAAYGEATVALQGAHVMTYQPKGQAPLIWLSKLAKLAPGKSIRGGVPVCWPWFGPHAANPQFPGHGYARTVPWRLVAAAELPDGRVRLEFELIESDATRAQWPHASTVRNVVTVGQELEVELVTTNAGAKPFQLGQALHTYFAVGDIRRATVAGLEGCDYIDKVDGGKRKHQDGQVTFTQETDRIYLGTRGCCGILDPALDRTILITSTGSRSTVVWNPWTEKADKMGDFGPEGHLGMVCVETANAAEDVITLAPGATHRMAAQYRIVAAPRG